MADSSAKAFLGQGWAFPVQLDLTSHDFEVVADEKDVQQAVLLILQTEPGERVMRPDFGAALRDLIFEPLIGTTIALVRYRVQQALINWEPRIDQITVTAQVDPPIPSRLNLQIGYRIRATNTFYNLVFPFYLQEGRL